MKAWTLILLVSSVVVGAASASYGEGNHGVPASLSSLIRRVDRFESVVTAMRKALGVLGQHVSDLQDAVANLTEQQASSEQPMVVDSNGTVVGLLYQDGSAVRKLDGYWVGTFLSVAGFSEEGSIRVDYLSGDCSGPGYYDAFGIPRESTYHAPSSTLYYASGPAQMITVLSRLEVYSGVCSSVSFQAFDAPLGTIDMSSFVPPFETKSLN